MSNPNYQTPGVYVVETSSALNSFEPVPTAIPAFIGYTPQTNYKGKSQINCPVKINSLLEFEEIFGHPRPDHPIAEVKHYDPHYYLVKQDSKPEKGDFVLIGTDYYAILPDPSTIYYLYNSVKIFFQNGGNDAYIVSVGEYGKPLKQRLQVEEPLINPHVQLNELLGGLESLKNIQEVSLYLCPDATLLSVIDHGSLIKAMLLQNGTMQTAISIFDIKGGHAPDPVLYTDDIEAFKDNTGDNHLDYGAVYYPFIGTTMMTRLNIDYTNIQGGDTTILRPILSPEHAPNKAVDQILDAIDSPDQEPLKVSQYHNQLLASSPAYTSIIDSVLDIASILPPSGAIAGIMTTVDKNRGVWQAPANVPINGTRSLTININAAQQDNLNIDAITGKSINLIRAFTGRGILVWGARTLDGNSNDWRYIPVRRSLIFIEQTCKLAAQAYVFEPNDANTWTAIKTMISNFLTGIWSQGGLAGATANDAFFVHCGLAETMTVDDILNGKFIVSIGVAVTRPAEFIIINFEQQMVQA